MPKNTKLEVQDLILEITRNCSMQCPHCMRGDRENINMPEELIRNVFSNVSAIECLTFTGGEPGCNPAGILTALKYAKKYKTRVRRIWLATNGNHADGKFLGALRKWHEYCLGCELPMPAMTGGDEAARILRCAMADPEVPAGLTVAISLDAYHDDIPSRNLLKLMTLPRITMEKYHGADDFQWVINQGLANWNGIAPENNPGDKTPWAYSDQAFHIALERTADRNTFRTEQLYIGAGGLVLKHCDYSYDDQEDFALDVRIDPERPDASWAERLAALAGMGASGKKESRDP